jgi:uncharacterized protein YfaS (alpha-2-macroglobulin family)
MKSVFIAIQHFFQNLLRAVRSSHRVNVAVGLILAGVLLAGIAVAVVVSVRRTDSVRIFVTEPKPRPLTENAAIPPLTITFSAPAAKIELVGKEVTQGLSISPDLEGKWIWSDDRTLVFFSRADWLPGTGYTAKLDPSIFSGKVKLAAHTASFHAAALLGRLQDAQLYVDPAHPEIKRITATVSFTHPVRVADLVKAVKFSRPFTVTWDKFFATAYIVSEAIPVPEKTFMEELRIEGSISSSRGGEPFGASLKDSVTVPGKYDYAKLTDISTGLVRSESLEYQKVLVVSANLGLKPDNVAHAMSVFLLPKDRPASPGAEAKEDYPWEPAEVDASVLALSTPLALTPVPIEGEFGEQVSFTYQAPSGRFLYLKVKSQIEAFGGYMIKTSKPDVIQVPDVPKEVMIMHEGSLLAMSGERKLSLYSNDLEAVQFEISRIIPDQVNNLITQTYDDMKDIAFRGYERFGLENMASIYQEVRPLKRLPPGQVQYFSFDFDSYLARGAEGRLRYGLFYFKVSEYDQDQKKATHVTNARLILVTDLGILAKKSVYTGYDVFVQSIHSGAPIPDAKVDVVGKNGLSVVSAFTGPDGHVFIPNLEGYTREKEPEAFVVSRGDDMSFLPVENPGRFLNFSRFDTGGLVGTADPGFIDAYIFSDRGIYRPGDLINFAVIVKAGDWAKKLAGLPLELSVQDPRGLEVQKKKLALGDSGFEQYSFRTEETAQTGKYLLSLYIVRDKEERKLLGSTSVRVEEFRPDRLAIRSAFSSDPQMAWASPKDLKATVTLRNLFGTPAVDNLVRARISLSPSSFSFPKYPDYEFFDPLGEGKTFEEALAERTTDAAGAAVFPIDLERFDKATFRLRFSADGMEKQGGRGVHAESSVVVSPLASVVGFKADGRLDYIFRDAGRSVHFVSVGPDQSPVPLSKLKLSLVEVRYVSVLEKGPDKLYRYKSVEKRVPVRQGPFAIPKEGAVVNLATGTPGDFELALFDSEDVKLTSLRYSVIGTGNLARTLDRNAELQVRLDRTDYSAGDPIKVSIKAPYTGAGLITVERDKVYAYKWFSSDTTASVQSITVPETVEGSAYVNVSFIRAIDSREIYASPLSYGVMPVSINREARSNRITLEAPAEIMGGSLLRISYSTAKPGRIVVYGVDEGILQVARYMTPRPLDHFFAKRALEVRTSQILDLILPEYSLIQGALATGGDEGDDALNRGLNPFKRKHKAPVVFWSGILPSSATPRSVEYQVPDYFNGTVKIMAVAVSDDSIGVQETRTVVRNHFVISPNVPPVASPGDEIEVGVAVMNNVKAAGKTLSVRVEMKPSGQFELSTPAQVTQDIAAGVEKIVFFRVRVKNQLGAGSLAFTASSASGGTGRVASSVEETVSIRPATPYRTQMVTGRARGATVEVPLDRKMHAEFRKITVSASYLPTAMSFGLKKYLDSYPYGCTEQIVSRAFAVLALHQLPDFGITETEAMEAFQRAQKVLRARQNEDGSFGLWAANQVVSDFVTAYAMHYLTEARESGYPVDTSLFESGMQNLKVLAGADPKYQHTSTWAAAYAIYVLTRNEVITTSYINALRAPGILTGNWRQGAVGVFLSGSYALMKQAPEARGLLRDSFSAAWTGSMANDYYSSLAQGSLCLFMASRHLPDSAGSLADPALERIASDLQIGAYNTIASSYAVLGLTAYVSASQANALKGLQVARKIRDKEWADLKLAGTSVLSADVPYGSTGVKISNSTANAVYYTVTEAGFDESAPTAATTAGIEAFREYTDAKGQVVSTVGIGDEVMVHLKIRTVDPKNPTVKNVAVVDMLPSGFEIVSDNARDTPLGQGSLSVDNVEVREDRLVLFCTVVSSAKDFVYRIRSINKGKFAVPPIQAEAMYDRKIWTQHPAEGYLTVGD